MAQFHAMAQLTKGDDGDPHVKAGRKKAIFFFLPARRSLSGHN